MKRVLFPGLVFVLALVAAHIFTLKAAPSIIMNKAMQTMQARGLELHTFVLGQRITPQTQNIVRPSPDLVYSLCLYDFSKSETPLEIRAGYWHDYGSISFFDARTNNYATVRIGEGGKAVGAKVLLMPPQTMKKEIKKGMAVAKTRPDDERKITSPTKRGLILIRRLVPSVEAYSLVRAVSRQDECTPITQ